MEEEEDAATPAAEGISVIRTGVSERPLRGFVGACSSRSSFEASSKSLFVKTFPPPGRATTPPRTVLSTASIVVARLKTLLSSRETFVAVGEGREEAGKEGVRDCGVSVVGTVDVLSNSLFDSPCCDSLVKSAESNEQCSTSEGECEAPVFVEVVDVEISRAERLLLGSRIA